MRKSFLSLSAIILLATSFIALAPSSEASTPSSTLTTCTDPASRFQIALKANQLHCATNQLPAIWHMVQSDSAIPSGTGFTSIRLCTSKSSFTYQHLASKCFGYQVSTNYYRAITAPITPVITASSAYGYDRAVLTLAKTALTDSPIVYYMVKNIVTGITTQVSPIGLTTLFITGLSAITSYSFQITAVSIDGASQTLSLSQIITTGAVPVVLVIAPPAHIYAIGDTGPGGGIVYYYNAIGFTCGSAHTATCHYLETAPSGWNTGADPTTLWAVTAYQSNGVSGITSDVSANNASAAIGLGYLNSINIVTQGNGTTTAAGLARSYTGGGMSDWYLPDNAELNQLCKYSSGQAWTSDTTVCTGSASPIAGFAPDYYWSSSEVDGLNAWRQVFSNGSQGPRLKSENNKHVRPVRAF